MKTILSAHYVYIVLMWGYYCYVYFYDTYLDWLAK
jgi:hypothetical protein